jgi:precorrin-4 methylase
MTEEWRPVVGHEGSYEVSDLGRVRSLDRVATEQRKSGPRSVVRAGRVLKPLAAAGSHLKVHLGRKQHKKVHHAVLEAFRGPCPPGMEGMHRDDDGANNRLENLRWGAHQENMDDAARNGCLNAGETHHLAKLKRADIPKIREALKDTPVVVVARAWNVDRKTIWQIKTEKTWKHVDDHQGL